MHTLNPDFAKARQQELARELRGRRWAGELRTTRRRDGSLWVIRLPRR